MYTVSNLSNETHYRYRFLSVWNLHGDPCLGGILVSLHRNMNYRFIRVFFDEYECVGVSSAPVQAVFLPLTLELLGKDQK